jgi:hypothetical protein
VSASCAVAAIRDIPGSVNASARQNSERATGRTAAAITHWNPFSFEKETVFVNLQPTKIYACMLSPIQLSPFWSAAAPPPAAIDHFTRREQDHRLGQSDKAVHDESVENRRGGQPAHTRARAGIVQLFALAPGALDFDVLA